MYFLDERRHKMAIKVTLLTHTPNPEKTVAMAAKLCYSPSGIEDISEGLTEEKNSLFYKYACRPRPCKSYRACLVYFWH